MPEYQSPQEREAERRRKVAQEQQRERDLLDNSKSRESRRCKHPGCGMPFWCAPQSKRLYCGEHDKRG